jgi:ATP-dependent DNA helicase RecQ
MSNQDLGSSASIDQIFNTYFRELGSGIRPTQRRIIHSVLNGNNTLGLMPTGAGKSLCYWISGLALQGVTLVIFPLTALMDEQAKKLADHGVKVFVLHSGTDSKKQYNELIDLYNAREIPDFIFVSPERLATDGFLEFVLSSIRDRIKLVVVDEAHCISQWGLDFRPFYKEIPYFLNNIYGDGPLPRILCLTATLNPKDKEQICYDFGITDEHVIRHDMLLRPEIDISVVKVGDEDEKDERFWALLDDHRKEKVLIYVDRKQGKRSTETLCAEAQRRGFRAAFFHGDMSSEDKADVIARFKSGELLTVFATNAFGMGIDIPDIRGVIHYLLTESTEQYYQQIGRVGRDGKRSWAVLFYSDKNVDVRQTWFIDRSFPGEEEIRRAFTVLTDNQTGKRTVNYFNEGDQTQSGYHYLVRSQTIQPICKGIQQLDVLELAKGVQLPAFAQYKNASRTGLLTVTATKTGESESNILRNIYQWLAEGKIKAVRAPSKCLVLQSTSEILPDDVLAKILQDVEIKWRHRTNQFNAFVALLEQFSTSSEFHQAIGEHLGIDRFSLQRIHRTLSGDFVRSKSEVIIANMLYQSGIPFVYEQPLYAAGWQRSPDFTIDWNGQVYYWEHLGMLNIDDYEQEWNSKKAWYDANFPGQLLTTHESATLSEEARQIIAAYFAVEPTDLIT